MSRREHDIKYSFIMPYHKRFRQLQSTFETFLHFYEYREGFEVILIEDYKSAQDAAEHANLLHVVELYGAFFPIKIVPGPGFTNIHNPAPLYNIGVKESVGEFLIITNPECAHSVDILTGFDAELDKNPNAYVVCACLSSPVSMITPLDLPFVDGQWFQHSLHRNVLCHFCSVLSRKNYDTIEGFDENYGRGICFEDDDFRNKILQANIPIIVRDDLMVVHLMHSKSKPTQYAELHGINKSYYQSKWGSGSITAEQIKL
jgi:hypothetical protein